MVEGTKQGVDLAERKRSVEAMADDYATDAEGRTKRSYIQRMQLQNFFTKFQEEALPQSRAKEE